MSDLISRQAAIDAVKKLSLGEPDATRLAMRIGYYLERLTSAQPEIIRCQNCKFASGDSRICMKFGHSPIGELDFCAWAERRTDE